MNEMLILQSGKSSIADNYEELSEQLELESIRYSRSLPEEEEARLR